MNFITSLLLCTVLTVQAKLLDRIEVVFNDKVITSSQIDRVRDTMNARKEISPMVYNFKELNSKNIAKTLVRTLTIREKLTELGFVVTDDQVEGQIKSTEKRLGLSRNALLQFLKSRNLSFDEYFEIIREAIEYNIFSSRIIEPLITISDQQLRSEFLKNFKDASSVTTSYDLINYRISKSAFKSINQKNVNDLILGWRRTGIKPAALKSMTFTDLNDVSEDGLDSKLSRVLKKTKIGNVSDSVLLGSEYHYFLVVQKKTTESENYTKYKDVLRSKLAMESADSIKESWLESESLKHYIRYF